MSKYRKKPTPTAAAPARPSADLVRGTETLARPVSEQSLVWASGAAIVISALVLLGMLAAPWLRGNVYTGGDLQSFNLPIRKFYADCLQRGDNPIWWPYIYCGFYLHGDGQTGIFHPGHWLLYRLLPLVAAFNIELLINYPLLFAGTYLFCRRRQLPVVPSLFGGFLFALCRFNVNHLDHPNLMATMTHVPWLLWLLDVLLTAARPRQAAGAALAIALLTGSQFLLGHPQSMWFTALVGGWYVAVRLPACVNRWRLAQLSAALVCGLAMGAVQWLPTYEALKLSKRAGADESFRSTGGIHPAHLFEYLAPSIFTDRIPPAGELIGEREWSGAFELYLGMFLPAAIVWLVIRGRAMEPWRGLAWASLALGLIAVALSLGRYFGPLHWIVLRIPVVGLFRSAFHTIVVASLGFSLLAACVLADVWRVAAKSVQVGWNRLAWLALVPLATLVLALVATLLGEVVVAGVAWRWAGFWPSAGNLAVALGVVGLLCAAGSGQRWATAALVVFTIADVGAHTWRASRNMPTGHLASLTAPIDSTARDPLWRVWMASKFPEELNQIALQGGRQPSGYAALAPRFEVLRDPELQRTHPHLLQQLTSTRWVIQVQSQEVPGPPGEPARIKVRRTPSNVPDALPRIRLVTAAVATSEPAQKILEIDPAQVALVDRELKLRSSPAGQAGRASFVSDRPGLSLISTDAPSEQLLVFGECWHPGWRASLNGEATPVVRTYGDLMGCVVPAGRAKVEFRFDPPSVRWGGYVSLAGLAGAAVLFAVGWLAVRRPTVEPRGE